MPRILDQYRDLGVPPAVAGSDSILRSGWTHAFLAPNDNIYCIPTDLSTCNDILVIPRNDDYYFIGLDLPNGYWGGAVLVDDIIYCAPGSSETIGVFNTTTETLSSLGSFPQGTTPRGSNPGMGPQDTNTALVGPGKFRGIWFNDGHLHMASNGWTIDWNNRYPGMVKVNPVDGSYVQYDYPIFTFFGPYPDAFRLIDSNGVLLNDHIYSLSWNTKWNGDPFGQRASVVSYNTLNGSISEVVRHSSMDNYGRFNAFSLNKNTGILRDGDIYFDSGVLYSESVWYNYGENFARSASVLDSVGDKLYRVLNHDDFDPAVEEIEEIEYEYTSMSVYDFETASWIKYDEKLGDEGEFDLESFGCSIIRGSSIYLIPRFYGKKLVKLFKKGGWKVGSI